MRLTSLFLFLFMFGFSQEKTHTIYFDTDHYRVTNIEENRLLSFIATLSERSVLGIEIFGFCDDIGASSYNLSLSQKRAEEIKKILLSNFIDESKITSVDGKGEVLLKTIKTSSPEMIRALNRKVELSVSFTEELVVEEKTNFVKNQLSGVYGGVPDVQRAYKAAGIESIVVGDHNYGEGSSREHAAMEPRHLGVKVVLVKSFARIHETNLKKQGMLGVTFANESDYDLIQEDDTFNFVDLELFSPGKPLNIEVLHSDGTTHTIQANHTYNAQQIQWFREGSALNLIKKQNAS